MDIVGHEGRIIKFNVSYRGVDFPYDDLKYYGKVIKKSIEDSKGVVYIELNLENSKGQITTPSTAQIELPIKKK